MIEPFALFSLINPMHQPIPPVKKMIRMVCTVPVSEKNITPCNNPNNRLCIIFPIVKPNWWDSLFNRNPRNSISSGSDVLNVAYTIIAGTAFAPKPQNTDVAVSTVLLRYRMITDIKIKAADVPIVHIANLVFCSLGTAFKPIH